MNTIVQPKEHIVKLWSSLNNREGKTFRIMRYVLRVDFEEIVILQNAVTGHLVYLDKEEAEVLEQLPDVYSPQMDSLIDNRFLVPLEFDEHQLVLGIRRVLHRLDEIQSPKAITKFTILPTSACNARCYYCFEQGLRTVTMTEQTAEDVVEFISKQCGNEKEAHITWFGGEPTVAADRIDQISDGLRKKGIQYESDMTSNGYLFDKEMIQRAKELWNLKYLQICFDGLETNHNATKAFVNAKDSPFQRILQNIGLFLEQGIRVGMRMNFDIGNHAEFEGLVKEAVKRFPGNSGLSVYAFPVIGEHPGRDGRVLHGSDEWFKGKIAELNEISRTNKTYHERIVLPYLKHHCCDAENRSAITITPEGALVRCCQEFGKDQFVGSVIDGINDYDIYYSWEESADFSKCKECVFFPRCYRLSKCSAKDRCLFYSEWCIRIEKAIKEAFRRHMELVSKGVISSHDD